jgi:hypothetical protein
MHITHVIPANDEHVKSINSSWNGFGSDSDGSRSLRYQAIGE